MPNLEIMAKKVALWSYLLTATLAFPAQAAPQFDIFVKENSGPDFSGDGRPGQGTAGGSRGECPAVEGPGLTALMPSSNYGETLMEQPTLWFYVPYATEQVVRGEFSLQDEDGNDISDRTAFTLPEDIPGFVGIALPEAFSLDENIDYQWYLELHCIADGSPLFVNGWIQRISPAAWTETSSPMSEKEFFIQNEIWFDALDSLMHHSGNDGITDEELQHWQVLTTAPGVLLEEFSEFVPEGTVISPPIVTDN